jgi:hypothetical protein
MIIACLSCSQLSAFWGNPNCEAPCDKDASHSLGEPDSASLRKNWEWSTYQRWRNLLPLPKQQADAGNGFPGVVEDGACREIVQEPGRSNWERVESQHKLGNHNRSCVPVRKSEKPIVVLKRGNSRGAKGLYCKHAAVQRRGEPLV